MTLANEAVREQLADEFVLAWRNIEKEPWRGDSHGYRPNQTAVGTTNGAGARNVQILMLSPDLRVLHALPGFWHPDDLLGELNFAKLALRLWRDETRTVQQKERMLALLHDAHVARLSAATLARSDWQSFDRAFELMQARHGWRDTYKPGLGETPELKPTIVIAHERAARQPFAALADFNIRAFANYGTEYYDNNSGIDQHSHDFAKKPKDKPVAKATK